MNRFAKICLIVAIALTLFTMVGAGTAEAGDYGYGGGYGGFYGGGYGGHSSYYAPGHFAPTGYGHGGFYAPSYGFGYSNCGW